MEKYSDLLRAIYECCASGNNEKKYGLQPYFEAFDTLIAHLPFKDIDAITASRNALCAKYEEAAFLDGFRAGAGLILELLQSDSMW